MTRRHGGHNRDLLASLPRIQVERLSYIDFRLYFIGELRRADLVSRFGTGPAGATRDIAMYREIAPTNLDFDATAKLYVPSLHFEPLFAHAPQRVLTALSQGFGQGVGEDLSPLLRCEFPTALSQPRMSVLAPITRAIYRGKAVRLVYHSLSSRTSERELVPLALVDTGNRWHVRAFDRKSSEFRDFVFTRMETPTLLEDSEVLQRETAEYDVQWSRIVELELVPHPVHKRPDVIRMDYDMPDGVLRVKVRAANVGYILRRWNVDCSPDHSLVGPEYALWLRDPLSLYGATNAVLAPGYRDPKHAEVEAASASA
jgi:predicted DNA-binding transcriptional regulator YafY